MKWNRYTRYKLLYLHWRLGELMFEALMTEIELVHNVINYKPLRIRYRIKLSPEYFNNFF